MLITMETQAAGGGKNAFYQRYTQLPETIDLGFTPKYVEVSVRYSSSHNMTFMYDADTSTTEYKRRYDNAEQNYTISESSTYAGFGKVGTDSIVKFITADSMTDAFVMATD